MWSVGHAEKDANWKCHYYLSPPLQQIIHVLDKNICVPLMPLGQELCSISRFHSADYVACA